MPVNIIDIFELKYKTTKNISVAYLPSVKFITEYILYMSQILCMCTRPTFSTGHYLRTLRTPRQRGV